MMESKKDAISGITFHEMDREIHKRFRLFLAADIEIPIRYAVEAALDNAVRSSVDTLLLEKST